MIRRTLNARRSPVARSPKAEWVDRKVVCAKTVLRLARNEGLSLREVAGQMGRSREAVKKLYGRALERFVEHFERLRGKDDD